MHVSLDWAEGKVMDSRTVGCVSFPKKKAYSSTNLILEPSASLALTEYYG
jgi:MFS superfamily sulfate permease-like transporter